MEAKTSKGDKVWANEIRLLKNLIAYNVESDVFGKKEEDL